MKKLVIIAFAVFMGLSGWAAADENDDVTAVLQITNQTYGNSVMDKYGQELDNAGNKLFLDNAYVNVVENA